jgi:hypothetical protein
MSDQSTSASDIVKIDPARPNERYLFKVSRTLEQDRKLDINPLYISLGLEPSAFTNKLGGTLGQTQSRFAKPKSVFDTAIRGNGQYSDRMWFFKGDSYIRYFEKPDGNDEFSSFLRIDANWPGWPPSFATGIDAALQGTGDYDGKIWFFKGNQYLRYDLPTDQVEFQPKPIQGNWRGVPDTFAQSIDAAIHGLGDYYGICWLFKGSQYVRYNLKTDIVEGEPRPIAGSWGGETWPASFADGIDFAFYGTGANAEKIYFFRGDQYILYNLKSDRVEEGSVPIIENWSMLARFMPQPQLFLLEKYALHIFRGETGLGDMIGSQSVSGKTTTEFYIVTKTSETISKSTSSNILESSSAQAVTAFSDAIKNDESESGSREKYDYGMDASFHGEVDIGLTGGETNADLHVRGSSQNVRNSFSKSAGRQLEHKANETQETHKQQVSIKNESSEINQQTETGFKQVVDNRDNPNPLNFSVFQLTQEYIVVLTLVDARLAFHNGNPRQSQSASIREMASLLNECLIEPDARNRIAATVVDTLQNIVDYAGGTRSLVEPMLNDPSHYQNTSKLTSTYEVKDSEGNLLRTIVVPGIILNVDRPVVLTPNTIMVSSS